MASIMSGRRNVRYRIESRADVVMAGDRNIVQSEPSSEAFEVSPSRRASHAKRHLILWLCTCNPGYDRKVRLAGHPEPS